MVRKITVGFIVQSDHRSRQIGRTTIESNECEIGSTFNCKRIANDPIQWQPITCDRKCF